MKSLCPQPNVSFHICWLKQAAGCGENSAESENDPETWDSEALIKRVTGSARHQETRDVPGGSHFRSRRNEQAGQLVFRDTRLYLFKKINSNVFISALESLT